MSLRPIEIKCKLFIGPRDLDRSRLSLTALMYGLSLTNRLWIQYHPKTPALYKTHVVYRAEPHSEHWQDIPTTLERGFGDCEDLACWRCGELQAKGINALPYVQWRKRPNGSTVYHALVRWPDGRIEDPSRALGMRHPITRKPVFIGVNRV